MSELIVAKFGGTSAAEPERIQAHLEYEHGGADIVVLSAPGSEDAFPNKATNMLLSLKANEGKYSATDIQDRFRHVLTHTGMQHDIASMAIVNNIPEELDTWDKAGWPIEALGEYWSAKLFAAQTGREFADPTEFMIFSSKADGDKDAVLDEDATHAAIRSYFKDDRQYVVPGFYGRHYDGSVQVLPRGGSDITGAEIAKAMKASLYENWSDPEGFMTADPRLVTGERAARFLDKITGREAREFGIGGSALLHPEVVRVLEGTGINTMMRQTFGPLGNKGTLVVDRRAVPLRPIVGVTGRDDLVAIDYHKTGSNENPGETVPLTTALAKAKISADHIFDAGDDLSILVKRKHENALRDIADELKDGDERVKARVRNAALLYVIGEGLAEPKAMTRGRTVGRVCLALCDAGIATASISGLGSSANQVFAVNPNQVKRAVIVAHDALELHKIESRKVAA